jgi:8-oxo-dGTP pyrophosphatase MutT (NUDIX family)
MNRAQPLSTEYIAGRLRALHEPAGLAAGYRPRHSDFDLNAALAASGRGLRPAAVLVPLVARAAGLTVLLTQRTDHLHHHAGQVSFPGGRLENTDRGPVDTALRETHEEVGIEPHWIEPVGMLDDYETVTGFLVTPVVSFLRPGFTLALDPYEVADAFEVPFAFVLDPANHQVHSRMRNGERRHYYVFEYGERYIWGATAGMLMNFYRRLHGLSGPMRPPGRDASAHAG